ncbi:Y4yA family PLP-dependent enzyme [Nocardia huaxiensis]|uniref:Y4yA family PLP-dependent enzyme n=1 Tax=Nocardia huaxiensis TaxID=2755382 RepID=UPI001E44D526|nr:Y4yA family PLP-dependent enzyme [Nocardia huaxiensis]UFS93677.1 Y4yA family PLP-dependent enzyme [Nocardia huaxiensis]
METTRVRASDAVSPIAAAPMPAHRDAWEQWLIADAETLFHIAATVAGPFHVLYPERVGRNIRGFRQAFEAAGVQRFAVYYGKKANKADCVVEECAKNGAGVDVSSAEELSAALAGGVAGGDLVVTGPAKSDALLARAAAETALIALDALDELERLITLGVPARVTLRMRDPRRESRFGMSEPQLHSAVRRIAEHRIVGARISLEGFSFHLSGYAVEPRAELAHRLITLGLAAREHCPEISTISIGGGFGVDYVPAANWAAFQAGMTPDWFHAGRAPALDNYYPYHFDNPGPGMLRAILRHTDPSTGRTLTARLNAAGLCLAIEPGRAVLDGAGCTVFRVQGVKELHARVNGEQHPYLVLTADGTSLSLSEQWFASEFLPDPALVSRHPDEQAEPLPACVGGASCLEDDMISRRRIPLPRRARTGDLLVYPNTAGYQMDSNESAFHELPVPRKVVLRDDPGGGFAISFDGHDIRSTSLQLR